MTQVDSVHPDPERLHAFGLGRLEATEMEAMEAHVAACEVCCQQLENLGDDGLIGLVRESRVTASEEPNEDLPSTVGSPSADPAADVPGPPAELVGHPRYQIVRILGSGGMGTVYQAFDRVMDRTVALKVIRRDLTGRADLAARFRREVQATGRLAHPNIVTAHDAVEEAGGLHFLVMEYIEGMDLARVVRDQGPLPVATASDFAWQAAEGLQHACERSMVHRDIKPANLMVTAEGRIKILDFGLARFARELDSELARLSTVDAAVTERGMLLGSYDYLAPEQADDPHAADIRADIYSLGCTLYYLLSGRPPFPEPSKIRKIKAHSQRAPEPIESLRPDVPAQLAAVLDRMMAKDAAARYQTPAEAARALAPFARPERGAVAPVPSVPATPQKPGSPAAPAANAGGARGAGHRHWLIVTVAVLTVAFIAFLLQLPRRTDVSGTGRGPSEEAVRLVERGQAKMKNRTETDLNNAIELFERATEVDPHFARAWSGLAACYALLGDYGWLHESKAYASGKAAVERALQFDSNSAEAHAAKGMILYTYDLKWDEAGRELEEALRLDPEYAEAQHWYAWYLAMLGRFDDALHSIDMAQEKDPLSHIIETNKGKLLYYAGRYKEAIRCFDDVLRTHPDYTKAIIDLALTHEQLGEYDAALAKLDLIKARLGREDTPQYVARGRIYACMGRTNEARKILDELLKRKDDGDTHISYYSLATLAAALGKTNESFTDQAFKMLDTAWSEHDTGLSYLKVDPRLAPLRKHPRFQDYLRRAGHSE